MRAYAAFVAFALFAWWPSRDLPFFWDGSIAARLAREMAAEGFWPLVPHHATFAHPPLFYALLGAAFRVFGESPLVGHALVLPFLPLAMAAIHAIGARLGGQRLGLAAAFAFGASPLVACEVGQVYFDLPVAALVACAVAAHLAEKRAAAGALLSAAVLMKVPAVAVAGALVVDVALRKRRDARAWALVLAPIATLGAWTLWHRHVTGWALVAPGEREYGAPSALGDLGQHLYIVGKVLLVDGVRWTLLAVAIGAALVLARRRALRLGPEALPLALWLAGGAAFFVVTNVFLARYVLLSFPAFVLLALWLARRAVPSEGVFAALALVVVVAQMSAWHPKRARTSSFEVQPPEDLGYLDLVKVLVQTSKWLEEKHPGALVYGGFHEEYALGEPFQGYVTKPLEVAPCRAFAPAPDREQLVVVHGYAPEQRRCQELIHSVPSRGLRRFEANGKWIEVHRVGAL